jgi:phosphoribosylaminoimidazolecarboxamide formyltransferase/IMP cyclohydrolase
MSYNNTADAVAASALVSDLSGPACAIIKHTNPCGVATAATIEQAFRAAWDCDPVSAFGGVVALNRDLDAGTARAVAAAGFVEVLVAPGASDEALRELEGKKGLRILVDDDRAPFPLDVRTAGDGFLVQSPDLVDAGGDWKVATAASPEAGQWDDLRLAWVVAAHTKSNAVVIATGGRAVGIGAGDQSRVGAAARAVLKAGDRARGAVAASDAFFPFRDGLDVLADAGVTAVVEPGGSLRDDEVLAAAEERGVALVLTGRRHFRH